MKDKIKENHRENRLDRKRYNKYIYMAKRRPVYISDESTEEEDTSDDGFPSPSPVRRDEYSKIVQKMRELERKLRKK